MPPLSRPTLRRDVWSALLIIAVAAAVRWPRMGHSLSYDEMTTLVSYVLQPWPRTLAAAAGQYVPNNHVLHTVLAKLAYAALAGGRAGAEAGEPVAEAVLRLPALVAGSLLPVALAWPLRRRHPWAALTVAVVAVVHPWLVELGAEARGYTLMLLLGVVATNLLPTAGRFRPAAYAAAVAGAIYTVPLAVLLVPAHAVAVWATRRDAARRWAAAAGVALLTSAAAYAPQARGLVSYYRHPFAATADYRSFLDALPRHALTGERLPRRPVDSSLPPPMDRVLHPDPPAAAVFWALPVLVVIVGTALGWTRLPDARPLLATLASVSVLAGLLPLVVPAATEVRFDTWTAAWFAVAITAVLATVATDVRPAMVGRSVAAVTTAVLVAQLALWDWRMPTNQPIREAMRVADRLAPADRAVVVAYLGADETVFCYGRDAPAHAVLPAADAATFADATAARPRPWVVVLFEQLARDRDRDPAQPAARGFWSDLSAHYHRVARLSGRQTPVSVYAPTDDGPPLPGPRPVALHWTR